MNSACLEKSEVAFISENSLGENIPNFRKIKPHKLLSKEKVMIGMNVRGFC